MIPFHTRILNQTKRHQISPYSYAKTAMEEKMGYGFLSTIAEPAKGISLKPPPTHPVLSNKVIMENKPQNKSMPRNIANGNQTTLHQGISGNFVLRQFQVSAHE